MVEALVMLTWPKVVRPDTVSPLEEALPKIGVIKVGEVCITFSPLPVLGATYKAPLAVDCTVPATFKEDKVVEPLAFSMPKVVNPETVSPEEEALPVETPVNQE